MKKKQPKRLLFLLVSLMLACGSALPMMAQAQKREFRGAWIQCVNGQFVGMSTQQMQQMLNSQLNELQRDGVNAIIFQVRPECDALYASKLEPWSRFLTGQQGRAPQPYWDPLQWMVEQCHSRGMELHAWINPYRAKTKTTNQLASSHVAVRRPDLVFDYDGLKILNPGIPENSDYICKVVDDIVARYDIDGLHIDDYFYPYPAGGLSIPDDAQYRQYNHGIRDRGDWRRDNVNLFIKQLGETIHKRKPWVKFGVSPFGIYRNQKSDPKNGSATNGLQNYDDLYADVLLWVNNGWIDYCVPQLYWEIGNKAADYKTLVQWWDKHSSARPLFIGEDVERTVKYNDPQHPGQDQMAAKHLLRNQMPHVGGAVLWYAKAVTDNTGNYGGRLRSTYWRSPALQPLMPFLDNKAPKKVRKMKTLWVDNDYVLFWTAPKGKHWGDVATRFVVYRFAKNEAVNTNDASHIVAITTKPYVKLPYRDGKQTFTYVVTALDRLSNESKIVKRNVKL